MDEQEFSVTRLRADVWVAAFLRRVQGQAGFAALSRHGDDSAGAIFIEVHHRDGVDLYGPQPMQRERRFERIACAAASFEVIERLDREARFDSDLWVVTVEDRDGRSFLLESERG